MIFKHLEKYEKLMEAVARALRIERAHLNDLMAGGWSEESMDMCACKENIKVYEEALGIK
jgi:hypothetical protein